MKKQTLLFFFILAFSGISFGQTLTRTNLYTFNTYYNAPIVNTLEPSFFGFVDYNVRKVGLSGNPQAISFGFYGDLGERMGVGVRAYNDSRGIFENFYSNATYQYKVPFTGGHQLVLGLSAGVVNRNLNLEGVSDEARLDPVIRNNGYNETNFNAGFAVQYSYEQFQILLSVPELVEQNQDLQDKFFAQLQYTFIMPNPVWSIMPSAAYYRHPSSGELYDGNVKLQWKDLIWIQPGYRSNGNLIGSVGLRVKNLEVAYAFQANQQVNENVAAYGNEIALTFRFNRKKKEDINEAISKSLAPLKDSLNSMDDRYAIQFASLIDQYKQLDSIQLEKIRDLATETNNQENDILDVEDIKPGYYIVVSTFEEEDRARDGRLMMNINKFDVDIAYDRTKGKYYVYAFRSSDKAVALKKMRQLRRSGIEDAWVLIAGPEK